jgi:hypothetical protein
VTDPAAPAAAPGPEREPEPERPGTEGPLVLQRYRKADGRQLILYRVSPDRS